MLRTLTSYLIVLMLLGGAAFVDQACAQDVEDDGEAALAVPAVTAADATEDAQEEEDDRSDEEKQLDVARAVADGLVVVQYHLQYDRGEDPVMYGSNQGRYLSAVIEQERPLEVAGFLVADDLVVTGDLIIHPRFIRSITVSFGDSVVDATPSAWAMDQSAMMLELASPLEGASPLEFDAEADQDFGVVQRMIEGQWATLVSGVSTTTVVPEDGAPFSQFSESLLLVSEDGVPSGLSMTDRFDVGDMSWQGSPMGWDWLSADDMALALDDVQTLSENVLVRVQLSFRSPPQRADMMGMGGYDDNEDTERDCLGILLPNGRVLILESLRQRTTRRLERIMVHINDTTSMEAQFVGSLENFGALVAELPDMDESIGGVRFNTDNIRDWRGRLLMLADVKMQGDNRIAYFAHDRIISCAIGYQEHIYPVLPGSELDLFLFNEAGELVAFPIAHRRKTSVDRGYGSPSPMATAAADLAFLMEADLTDYVDEANVPVSEEDEQKLAWIGVTLQGLNQELAREYGVSDMTNDGATGAIVGYVYPNSPAAEAGVEADWVLLRLHVEDEPRPLEVTVNPWVWEVYPFPWEMYVAGQVPEEQYEEIPTPWARVETMLTRSLTDLGFGTAFEAEFFVDGEVIRVPFEVVESPAHYESAPRYENETMGMTVRDLTFEVRRYLRLDPDEPGVVVSKIEPGSLAAVAEIMPFEVITHVNDQPVFSVDEFEAAIAGQAELRFDVLHRNQSHLADIRMPIEEPEVEDAIEDDLLEEDMEMIDDGAEIDSVEMEDAEDMDAEVIDVEDAPEAEEIDDMPYAEPV